MSVNIPSSSTSPYSQSPSATAPLSPSPTPASQPQISPTPNPWSSATPPPSPPPPSGAPGTHSGTSGTNSAHATPAAAAPPLSPAAQKLQQLPKAQQEQLIQQNKSLDNQKTALLESYPSLPKQATAQMQQWVDDTYGPGHDVTQLYLVRYGKDPHGHPSHGNTNPALEQEGAAAETIPLWRVLQNNMSNDSLFGNDYSANRQQYKIVDARDVGKKYSDAKSVLDPEKLYNARDKVNFKVDLGKAVDQYYDAHKDDIAKWAKQRALTQLEVQHATGTLSDSDYKSIKNLLEKGEGGKIYTLSLGDNTTGGSGRFAFDNTLAGGMRMELDSGKHFTYLPKEEQPYQAFDSDLDAIESIRKHGKDPKTARDFVQKYRSLLGDPFLENPLVIKDMQEATVGGVFNQAHGNFKQLMHGKERDITHDPFGALTAASHANDSQDAWDGIKSNTDISRATFEKWGKTGLEVVASLPIGAESIGETGAIVRNGLGKLSGEVIEHAEGAGEVAGAVTNEVAGVSKETPQGVATKSGDGNLGAIDELSKSNHPDAVLPSRLPPKADIHAEQLGPLNKDGVYPGKDGNQYVRIGRDYYQVRYDKQLQGWIAVDSSRPNDFNRSVPIKLDGKGGAEPLPRQELKGGTSPIESKTKDLRITAARIELRQAQDRARAAHAQWQEAIGQHDEALGQSETAIQISSARRAEKTRLQTRYSELRNIHDNQDIPEPVRNAAGQEMYEVKQRLDLAIERYNSALGTEALALERRAAALERRTSTLNAYWLAEQQVVHAQIRLARKLSLIPDT